MRCVALIALLVGFAAAFPFMNGGSLSFEDVKRLARRFGITEDTTLGEIRSHPASAAFLSTPKGMLVVALAEENGLTDESTLGDVYDILEAEGVDFESGDLIGQLGGSLPFKKRSIDVAAAGRFADGITEDDIRRLMKRYHLTRDVTLGEIKSNPMSAAFINSPFGRKLAALADSFGLTDESTIGDVKDIISSQGIDIESDDLIGEFGGSLPFKKRFINGFSAKDLKKLAKQFGLKKHHTLGDLHARAEALNMLDNPIAHELMALAEEHGVTAEVTVGDIMKYLKKGFPDNSDSGCDGESYESSSYESSSYEYNSGSYEASSYEYESGYDEYSSGCDGSSYEDASGYDEYSGSYEASSYEYESGYDEYSSGCDGSSYEDASGYDEYSGSYEASSYEYESGYDEYSSGCDGSSYEDVSGYDASDSYESSSYEDSSASDSSNDSYSDEGCDGDESY